ncbi:hypothetical protein IWZ03DRAFT_417529 [Phyllosticta citriasiana]|uniref:Uncharacterized protein n=1 Tax=Phyllosticta citriasiana TaxID=595635 RepID=A0ABR1KHW3_9PEZI
MSAHDQESMPEDTREERCAIMNLRSQEFSTEMMRNAPAPRFNDQVTSVRLRRDGGQKRDVRQNVNTNLLRYWCFNMERSVLYWIPPTTTSPSPALDLKEFHPESFRIFSDWMKDFRLPIFDHGSSCMSNESAMRTIEAIDSYFLGWRLGAPVFCNLLMKRLCKLYGDRLEIPGAALVQRACKSPGLQNPAFKFAVHVYLRAEARCKEELPGLFDDTWRAYSEIFRDFIESDFSIRNQVKDPGSLVANACDYHVHFDMEKSSDGDYWDWSFEGWEEYLRTTPKI